VTKIFNFEQFEDAFKANEIAKAIPELVINNLVLTSIKHNYPEFVAEYGNVDADIKMASIFGAAWEKNKEVVWQWFGEETAAGGDA